MSETIRESNESRREREIAAYRDTLIEADKCSVQEYDKAVMTLSGGAIGLSFTFLKNLGSPDHFCCSCLLLTAWFVWGASIVMVLASHYFSHRAMRRALEDLHNNQLNYKQPGRGWDTAINILNPLGGGFFFVGLLFFMTFVGCNANFHNKTNPSHSGKTVITTTTTTTQDSQGDSSDSEE